MRQIPTPNSPYSPDRHTRLRTALAVLLLLLLAASLMPSRTASASCPPYGGWSGETGAPGRGASPPWPS